MDTRQVSTKYTNLGNAIIEQEPALAYIKHSTARIVFLESEAEKKSNGKLIYGQCEKVANKYKWGIPCDFTITIFAPNVAEFTEAQINVLLLHELLHVGIDPQTDGTEKYFIKPHDLEDFKLIIDRYGTEWAEDNQLSFDLGAI